MKRALYAVFVLILAGCGGNDGTLLRTTFWRSAETPRPRRSYARPSALEPAVMSGRPFASSPITETAEALTDLALAAIERRPLPTSPIPTDEPLGEANVEWPEQRVPLRQLSVLAVAFEIDLVLKRGEVPTDAVGPARWGSLRATVALSRNGLRLVELRPGEPRDDDGTPPPGLEGIEPLARDLIARLRTGDLSVYELTEDDRRLLANDNIWARVQHDRPHHGRLRDVQTMLEELPSAPLGYRLDDISILARDAEGRFFALSLELDPRNGSFVLNTSPLVTVRQLWPRELPQSLPD